MAAALIILALGSVLAGYVGVPHALGGANHLEGFLEPAFHPPAHGPAVTKPRQLVRGMIGHRRSRENQILKLIGEGTGIIEEMVPQMYKGVDRQLWPAAGRSVLAHLIDLEARGMVLRVDAAWALAS